MALRAALVLLLLGLLSALRPGRDVVKSTTPPPKKPTAGDDFSLKDALPGGGHNDPVTPAPPKTRPHPKPNQPGTSGGISDSDLLDGNSAGGAGTGGGDGGGGGGGGNPRHDGEGQAESQGVVPGIVGAVVVAVAGAISSFIAYQKKKLCFKENADQGDINMENHRNANAEAPVQRTLLDK